jgi:hypothetical protein
MCSSPKECLKDHDVCDHDDHDDGDDLDFFIL